MKETQLHSIKDALSSQFSDKLSVDTDKSGGITSMIMDKVLGMFGDKLGSNFEIGDLLGMIGGGKSGGIGGMLGKLGRLFGKQTQTTQLKKCLLNYSRGIFCGLISR